jgi:hypothetical protein
MHVLCRKVCLSRPALGPTQHPVQWVPDLFRIVESGRGLMLTPHPLLVPRSKSSRAVPLLSLRAFVAYKKSETYLPAHYSALTADGEHCFVVIAVSVSESCSHLQVHYHPSKYFFRSKLLIDHSSLKMQKFYITNSKCS